MAPKSTQSGHLVFCIEDGVVTEDVGADIANEAATLPWSFLLKNTLTGKERMFPGLSHWTREQAKRDLETKKKLAAEPVVTLPTVRPADELTELRAAGLHSIRNEFESNPEKMSLYLERERAWSAKVKDTMVRLGCTTAEISRVMDITHSEIGRAAAGADYGPEGNWLIGLMEVRLSRLWEVIQSLS